jgi:hypothetical protein
MMKSIRRVLHMTLTHSNSCGNAIIPGFAEIDSSEYIAHYKV